MADVAGLWRDVWRQLGRNPLLLLLAVLALGVIAECAVQVIAAFYLFLPILGMVAFTGAEFIAAMAVCLGASLIAAFVLTRGQSSSGGENLLMYWPLLGQAALLSLVIALVQVIFGFVIGLALGMTRLDPYSVGFLLFHGLWGLAYAAAKTFSATLFLPRLARHASRGLAVTQPMWRRQRRGFVLNAFLVFLLSTAITVVVPHVIVKYSSIAAAYRFNLMASALEIFLAASLAFVAFRRVAADQDPAIISVFD